MGMNESRSYSFMPICWQQASQTKFVQVTHRRFSSKNKASVMEVETD